MSLWSLMIVDRAVIDDHQRSSTHARAPKEWAPKGPTSAPKGPKRSPKGAKTGFKGRKWLPIQGKGCPKFSMIIDDHQSSSTI
jgi:hypothetical protein